MSDDRVPPHPLDAGWRVNIGTEVYGPYAGHQIKDFVEEGRVTAASLVTEETGGLWRPMAEIPELGKLLKGASPSAPGDAPVGAPVQGQGLVTAAHAAYALLLLGGFFTWLILPVVGLIVAYVSRQHARDTWLESHFTWQIVTFWYGVAVGIVVLLLFAGIGGAGAGEMISILIGGACAIWLIFRYIKGWLMLSRGKPVV